MFTFEMFNSNSGWMMQDGVQICILRKHEVAAWTFKMEQALKADAIYQAEILEARRAAVADYLAARALRPSSTQINLF